MKRRVVITGLGLVTPLGIGVEPSWQALCQGKSGVGPITQFDATNFKCRIASEVKDFNPRDFVEAKLARRKCRFIHLAIAASRMAVEDSGLVIDGSIAPRVGVSVGNAVAGIEILEDTHQQLLQGDHHRISPFSLPGYLANMSPGLIAIQFGARGPNICTVAACASGQQAIGSALRAIQQGEADVMIAGASEAPILPTMFATMDALRATSTRNDAPEQASRPFDKDRDGMVIGEGSGIVILEELEFARNRGARIYAEVIGYGLNCDAHHITSPDPEGQGAADCIEMGLADAGITPDQVDYINAHGTSTYLNDLAETLAIKRVFQQRAQDIPISSTKSVTGHLWGSAAAVEAVFCSLAITHGVIPPTINYETPDPLCDLDYVPNKPRRAAVKVVLSNAFGFGGTNATLVFRQPPI